MSVMYSRLNPFEHRLESPIPVAFGITGLDVGGAEKAMVGLATRLDRSRWSPSVVCLQPEGPLAEPLRSVGIPVRSLNIRRWMNLGRAWRHWRRDLVERRPAILQTFLFHANVLGRFVGRHARTPVVVSGIRVAERRTKGHVLADRLTHRLSDAQVCVSRAVAAFQIQEAGISRSRTVVIPNGIELPSHDLAPADWSDLGLPLAPVKLAFVGRLEPQKGLADLFDAMSRLPKETKPSVAVIGSGPDREWLEDEARRLGLAEHVRFLGWRPNPMEWMAAADALVVPSRWEGMPNVVLEAMAVGKPVVAADVEGIAELVEDGRTGWVATPKNPASIADAVVRCLADRRRWKDMGESARRKAVEEFSFERVVGGYERLWLDLLERHRRRTRPSSHHVVPNYRN
jgi:glycosyltransferase involved in cell wall biosynthesis